MAPNPTQEIELQLDLDALGLSARATDKTAAALAANAAQIDALLAQAVPDAAALQFLRTRPAMELEDLARVAGHLRLPLAETCAVDARSVRITTGAPAPTPTWWIEPGYAPPTALEIPDVDGPDPDVYAEVLLEDLDDDGKAGPVGTLTAGWVSVLALHGPDNTSSEAHRMQRVLCSDPGCTDGRHSRSLYPCQTRRALAAVIPT